MQVRSAPESLQGQRFHNFSCHPAPIPEYPDSKFFSYIQLKHPSFQLMTMVSLSPPVDVCNKPGSAFFTNSSYGATIYPWTFSSSG